MLAQVLAAVARGPGSAGSDARGLSLIASHRARNSSHDVCVRNEKRIGPARSVRAWQQVTSEINPQYSGGSRNSAVRFLTIQRGFGTTGSSTTIVPGRISRTQVDSPCPL